MGYWGSGPGQLLYHIRDKSSSCVLTMLEQLIGLIGTMNRLSVSKRAQILRSLTEGVSIRGTARLVGVSKTTILKLLVEVGAFCERYQDQTLRNLNCKMIQADELWAFVGAKPKHTENPYFGDVWTFTAMDADSKLMVSWLVGNRTIDYAHAFMRDVASRLANRVQLTTDGHYMYLTAVEEAFGWNGVDYAMLVKRYASSAEGTSADRRYSPPICTGTAKKWVMGQPVKELVSTSYVEPCRRRSRGPGRRRRPGRVWVGAPGQRSGGA